MAQMRERGTCLSNTQGCLDQMSHWSSARDDQTSRTLHVPAQLVAGYTWKEGAAESGWMLKPGYPQAVQVEPEADVETT